LCNCVVDIEVYVYIGYLCVAQGNLIKRQATEPRAENCVSGFSLPFLEMW